MELVNGIRIEKDRIVIPKGTQISEILKFADSCKCENTKQLLYAMYGSDDVEIKEDTNVQ